MLQVNMKIVVVEDEPAIRTMYKTKLSLEGFEVYSAENASEGLRIIKEKAPDIILLDIRMPGMPGDEMLAKLRSQKWGASIRVIVLTNLSRNEAPSSLRYLNVDRYVVKAHHTPAQIVEIVREVLNLPGKQT